MATKDPWKRYLDVGMELTNLTRERAEKIVRDFVKAGEVQREHAQQRVEDLLERSRKASSDLADTVRSEVTRQLTDLGLIKSPVRAAATTAKKPATTAKAAAKKSTAAAKKSAARTAKKATATVKKSAGSAAKKSTGAAKKVARKTAATAKKATGQS